MSERYYVFSAVHLPAGARNVHELTREEQALAPSLSTDVHMVEAENAREAAATYTEAFLDYDGPLSLVNVRQPVYETRRVFVYQTEAIDGWTRRVEVATEG